LEEQNTNTWEKEDASVESLVLRLSGSSLIIRPGPDGLSRKAYAQIEKPQSVEGAHFTLPTRWRLHAGAAEFLMSPGMESIMAIAA
jgi:hypothetical protein